MFIYYFWLLVTGTVVLFFLKFLDYNYSLTDWLSSFPELVPFGKYLVLKLPTVFYSEILASFKLDILGAFFVYSITPSLFIFNWKSSIHPILSWGCFVNILEIILFKTGEIGPGKDRFWVLSTYMRLAIEFDWKGQCPNTIS